ncbi:MAG: aminotransferase class V-fold PLP-dependent enzyme [Clostridia bacterium]|nr:aminotransferase class V-fold PLP-dependent enzyme [Clostridia bacterium]
MVYLDNAATTFPKPREVIKETESAMRELCGNPGRGSHRAAAAAAERVYRCRETAGSFFGAPPENVVLTCNATAALNIAIKGYARDGGRILISDMEHNSVLRPAARAAEERGAELLNYETFPGDDGRTVEGIRKLIKPGSTVVVASHMSNICGRILPIAEIGELCRDSDCVFVVDGSQSAGRLKIDVSGMKIDALCVPGHKGLYGPQGTGLLVLGNVGHGLPRTLTEGGSGLNSIDITMPDDPPERYEAGTLNSPGAAGLSAGIEWVGRVGIDRISEHEDRLCRMFRESIAEIPGVTVYSDEGGPVALFGVAGKSPAGIGAFLDGRGICVRSGLHCAPLAHKTLGTAPGGAVRASFGFFNTASDVKKAVDAVRRVAAL